MKEQEYRDEFSEVCGQLAEALVIPTTEDIREREKAAIEAQKIALRAKPKRPYLPTETPRTQITPPPEAFNRMQHK